MCVEVNKLLKKELILIWVGKHPANGHGGKLKKKKKGKIENVKSWFKNK